METTFKDTKLGQIPEEWEVTTIDKILVNQRNAIVDGPFGSNMKNSDYVDSGVPVFQGKNITGNRFVWSDIRYISYEKAQELIRSKVIVGDILLIKIGSIGYSALIDTLYGFNYAIIPANLLKMSINEEVYSKAFLLQYLQDTKTVKRLQNAASQTAQPALSLTTVRKFVIMMPPLPEQRKIAEILSTVDEAIETTETIIQQTQQLKKGLMQKLFTEGIGHTRFKETKIGRIPEEWEVNKFSGLARYINGRAFKPEDWGKTGLPIIRILQLNNPQAECDYFNGEIDERNIINNGDLIFSWSATLAVIIWNRGKAALNQHLFKVIPSKGIDKRFLLYRLDVSMEHLAKMSHGSTMKHIKKSVLDEVYVAIPPLPEQRKMAEILSEVDAEINAEQSYKAELEHLKKGLMQVLLTGQVRVKV